MRLISVLVVLSAAFLIGCSGDEEGAALKAEEYSTGTVTIRNSAGEEFTFGVEIPLTEEGFRKGLMSRERLNDDEGMLFIFEGDAERSFWMKNTLIDLDMLFIGSDFEIKKIRNAVPCVEDPCPHYESGVPVRYVLEIRGGLADELSVTEGDLVEIGSAFSKPLNI